MGENSRIEWTHHTFNPWRGCSAVSEGCRFCYAETLAKRFPAIHGTWGVNGRRVVASEAMWRQPLKWDRDAAKAGERRRVFCASMADVFERLPDGHPDKEAIVCAFVRLRDTIKETPALDWLLLTKRPENVNLFLSGSVWPRNAWLGVSVENQEMADKRIPILLDLKRYYDIPVAFLSVEPMLGAVRLPPDYLALGKGGWCIVGGESGAKARPMEWPWAGDLFRQCRDSGVPFFMKQFSSHGGYPHKDFAGFPGTLQVREFPR